MKVTKECVGKSRTLLTWAILALSIAQSHAANQGCRILKQEPEKGQTPGLRAETVVDGLEVPWSLAFLSKNEFLVTERPGRLRIVRNHVLQPAPLLEVPIPKTSEGGLLGVAAHPQFTKNRWIYLYRTTRKPDDTLTNRVERYRLSQDHSQAELDRIILNDIPAAAIHNGGRIRFGRDGHLYIGTGDSRQRQLAQDPKSLAGKILRITADGAIPPDNPSPQSPVFISGVRNSQGFDWLDDGTLIIADHGPSGELGRTGADELNFAQAGANLGWPEIWKCEKQTGMTSPAITWEAAHPPGGLALFHGNSIPGWNGSILMATLASRALYRFVVERAAGDPRIQSIQSIQSIESYFKGEPPNGLGRIREVILGPDGFIYLTTSNCDGRGSCPASKDSIRRLVR